MDEFTASLSSALRIELTHRVPTYEHEVQDTVQASLVRLEVPWVREAKIGKKFRIDFKVERIGIEIKKGRPASKSIASQVERYLRTGELDGVIVICERRPLETPSNLAGLPVRWISIGSLRGVTI